MDELRSWWEVPSIAHFCSLFRSAFELTDFDIEDLEEALIESGKDEGSEFLIDLVCRLLNGCYCRKDITVLNFDIYVKDVIKYKWEGTGNPIAEKSEFQQLTTREKVELLHSICEYRLDAEDVPELLKGFEGDNMRVEPLGKDKDGGTYWYFYGSRLYKEDPPPKKEVSREEKREKDRQRKKELEKKRREEKKHRKKEKQKAKAAKKVGKIAKATQPVVEPEDDGNIRRSGRLKIKKELKKFVSESSESSSEDETEDSSSSEEEQYEEEEEEEEDPVQEKPTKQKNSKKTPARKTPARKTPAKKTEAKKTPAKKIPMKKAEEDDTPKRPQRQSGRQKGKSVEKTLKQKPVEEIPELDDGVRRSGRIRKRKQSITPVSQENDSESEEETKDEIDSGHESGVSDDDDDTKSETSKLSVKSSMSKCSHQATPIPRRITLPRASAHVEKTAIDKEEEEGGENEEGEAEDSVEKKEDQKEVENTPEGVDDNSLSGVKDDSLVTDKAEKEKELDFQNGDNITQDKDIAQVEDQTIEDTDEQMREKPHLLNEAGSAPDNNLTEDIGNSEITDSAETNSENIVPEVLMNDNISKAEEDEMIEDKTEDDDNDPQQVEVEMSQSQSEEVKCKVFENDLNGKSEVNNVNEDLNDKTVVSSKVEQNEEHVKSVNENVTETNIFDTGASIDENLQDGSDIKNEAEFKDITEEVKCEITEGIESVVKADGPSLKTENEVLAENEKEEDIKNCIKDETNEIDIKVEKEDTCDVKKVNTDDDIEADSIETKPDKCLNSQEEDDQESQEKEKEPSGPKTTLGKQKPFVAVPPTPSKSDTRWHMVCSTLDDWINLAEWFSNSQVRCEKMLVKLINEDFLPVLPEIIEAREKERKRRLQELELRRSNRITQKMKVKIEQEKILAEALVLEEKERIRVEEERRLKEEQQRLEEENRLREERLKAREERAKRLSMREERARLIAEGKEIPPELLYTASNKYNDDYESDDSRCDLKDNEDFNNLLRLVEAMKLHKDCWPFLEPVTDEVAPGYSEAIKRPMDLSKIEEKIKKRDYRSTQQFLTDFRLMFNNCKRFNGPDSEFTECARSMEQVLKKYRKRFLMDEPADSSYYHDKDFTVSVNKQRMGDKDKKFRPRRAASSRAMETVHKALNTTDDDEDEESSSDEELEPLHKRRKHTEFPAKEPSHQSLLLQEMIEMKRQREKNLAASALNNHQVITRGPERIRMQNPQGGVTIMPRGDLPTKGLLKLAATREIKRKVNPQFVDMVDLSKKDPGLSVKSDIVGAGIGRGKTIKIMAPTTASLSGNAVKDTAESVKVSADGYLIIGGKNSGIKVSENTKIIVQPPGTTPLQDASKIQPQGRELVIKKIPTPSGMKELPDSSAVGTQSVPPSQGRGTSTFVRAPIKKVPGILNASSSATLPNPQGNFPVGIRQHQIINKGLNSSSGLVTQNPSITSYPPTTNPSHLDMLNKKQRVMIQRQQQSQQEQQQNGAQSTPPKIIKLTSHPDPAIVNPSHMTIEDRLREPNLDKVSENVVKSVNIAGDILDSYYSVFNSAKSDAPSPTKPSIIQQPSKSVKFSHETKTIVSPDIRSLLLQTVVNNKTLSNVTPPLETSVNQSSTVGSGIQSQLKTTDNVNTHYAVQSNLTLGSSANLVPGTRTNLTIGTIANSSLGTNTNLNPNSLVQVSNVHVGHAGQSASNSFEHTANHNVIQLPAQNVVPTVISKPANMTPIEALLSVTSNSTLQPTSISQSKPTDQNTIQLTVTPPISKPFQSIQNELLKPVPSDLRQNLFDMFGSNKQLPVQIIDNAPSSQQETVQGLNKALPNSEILTSNAKSQSSSTVNFGSPLKTMSIMEALKSKLAQPGRQDQQKTSVPKPTSDMTNEPTS